MNPIILALVCLLTLFIAAPAYAADIIVDNSCSIQDAIIAANTDEPAGNCPAGSGADTITPVEPVTRGGFPDIELLQPLPQIASTITIRSPIPDWHMYMSSEAVLNPAIEVVSGGRLTLERVFYWNTQHGGGRTLVVRRGGQVNVVGGGFGVIPLPCGAIFIEGTLTISGATVAGKSGGRPDWTPEPGAVIFYNNGGRLSQSGITTNSFSSGDFFLGSGGDCGAAPGLQSAAVSRPAPECKLEPQLQVGDTAIRTGSQYSNLRSEAGINGELVGRIEVGAVVDVIEGSVKADDYNWYRVTAGEDLEGWVAEAPARSFNCRYYFMSFTGELPPEAPETTPEREACDEAEALTIGGFAVIARGSNINLRAEAGLAGRAIGSLAPGTVLEALEGPEEASNYQWWKLRNVIKGIDGWAAEGGVVSSGQCVRWLLPLEAEEELEVESDTNESADEMMDEESGESEPEEATDEEDTEQSSP